MPPDSSGKTLTDLNPIARAGKILQQASPAAPAVALPVKRAATRSPSGDIELPKERKEPALVDWMANGRRMTGTREERDRAMAKKTSPASRSVSKGGR